MQTKLFEEKFRSLAIKNRQFKQEGNDKEANLIHSELENLSKILLDDDYGILILEKLCGKDEEDYVRLAAGAFLYKIRPSISKRVLKELEQADSIVALEAQLLLMSLFGEYK